MIIIYYHQVKYSNVQLTCKLDLKEFDLIHETYAINHVDGELKQKLIPFSFRSIYVYCNRTNHKEFMALDIKLTESNALICP